jgi:hypothetical protein
MDGLWMLYLEQQAAKLASEPNPATPSVGQISTATAAVPVATAEFPFRCEEPTGE